MQEEAAVALWGGSCQNWDARLAGPMPQLITLAKSDQTASTKQLRSSIYTRDVCIHILNADMTLHGAKPVMEMLCSF